MKETKRYKESDLVKLLLSLTMSQEETALGIKQPFREWVGPVLKEHGSSNSISSIETGSQ